MQIPLDVSFRGVHKTPQLESLLQRKVEKLSKFNNRVTSCRVAIERLASASGNPFQVRITLAVPSAGEIAATKDFRDPEKNGNLPSLLHDAFDAIERQLKELTERQRRVG